MTSVIRYTPLVILRMKNPRIWPQPTKFQYLSEIFKLEFQGSPPSGPLFFKKTNQGNHPIFFQNRIQWVLEKLVTRLI